ncbi:MAG: ABC-type multidrug transport system fused ATPase/permease subunit [Lentimonas sp.]|jgi:ABC-type multidrug transport system fused ATPase/permease subunit
MYLKRFSPYFKSLKPVRFQLGIGLIAGIIHAGSSGLGLPLVIQDLDPLVTQENKPTGWALAAILLSIPTVVALRAVRSYIDAYFIADSGMYVLEQLRQMVFERIQTTLEELSRGRTVFIHDHCFSTIQHADRKRIANGSQT